MAPEAGQPPETADGPEAARYIACLADELARLAKRHDFEALGFILDMARIKADQIAKGSDG